MTCIHVIRSEGVKQESLHAQKVRFMFGKYALKKKIRRYRHNCGSLTYIILEIYRKPRFACISSALFQPYELLLQQYFWLTVKYILLNYLKTFSYIHMADKSQAFLSVCFMLLEQFRRAINSSNFASLHGEKNLTIIVV